MLGNRSKELPPVPLPKYQPSAAISLGISTHRSWSCLQGASNSLHPQNPTKVRGGKGKLPLNFSDEYKFQNIQKMLFDRVGEQCGNVEMIPGNLTDMFPTLQSHWKWCFEQKLFQQNHSYSLLIPDMSNSFTCTDED